MLPEYANKISSIISDDDILSYRRDIFEGRRFRHFEIAQDLTLRSVPCHVAEEIILRKVLAATAETFHCTAWCPLEMLERLEVDLRRKFASPHEIKMV